MDIFGEGEMANLLKKLEERLESKIQKQVGILEPKLDEMIRLLKKIEKNTRKG